jgi:hypothetical protein
MPLQTYAEVQAFIKNVLDANHQSNDPQHAPHLDFWSTMSYTAFTTGNVPGVVVEGNSVPILVKGNSQNSNLILSLQGKGPLFGPTGAIGQMPASGPPMFTDVQIKEIADWIDRNCPQ